jgi:hypothetical protein
MGLWPSNDDAKSLLHRHLFCDGIKHILAGPRRGEGDTSIHEDED